MKKDLKNLLLVVSFIAVSAITSLAVDEPELITILQSNADVPQKCDACLKLRIVGTAKSVPALSALLSEERTGHAARYALEGMPVPEAGAALREALSKNPGLIKTGLIDSLGWRRDVAALPLLQPLLNDADVNIASAAASALSRIGGKEATSALSAIRDQAPPAVQSSVLEGLLRCAETLSSGGDNSGAAAIYRDLAKTKYPVQVRTAAWRGLVLSDAGQRADLIVKALAGTDRPVQVAALKLVRDLSDTPTISACLAKWASLPAESQLAVLDAHLKLGADSLPSIRAASTSQHVSVRVAAWRGLAGLNETSFIPALVKVAASGEPDEREAARESLTRVRGPGMREALLAYLDKAESAEKAEVLHALGLRGDTAATSILLHYAGTGSEPVRNAALDSLRLLAVADTLAPLLDLAARSNLDADREPVLRALYAVCEASPDKVAAARRVVDAIGRFPVAERAQALPLLAELGTPDALNAAQEAARDNNLELVKKAVSVLAQWPNSEPAPFLLEMARSHNDPVVRTLALRGAVEVAGHQADAGKRMAFLQQAMNAAKQPAEKKQVLGQVGQVPSTAALDFVMLHMADPALADEAAVAAVSIAEKLAPSNARLADEAATKVLARIKEGDVAKRAWALRIKSNSIASFIQDWVVCGPYRQAGVTGAKAVFDIPFGPEKAAEEVEWRSVPRADHVNFTGLFPGQDDCVAYLRTEIIAPSDCEGALLMGSDDGVKAWLNGKVVHGNNVDRGELVDQDSAPISLKKGTNELLLKITQGGGGWSACARFVGQDGKPIPGLVAQLPGGSAASVNTR